MKHVRDLPAAMPVQTPGSSRHNQLFSLCHQQSKLARQKPKRKAKVQEAPSETVMAEFLARAESSFSRSI